MTIVLIIDHWEIIAFIPCFYFIFWQADKHLALYKNLSVEPKDLS